MASADSVIAEDDFLCSICLSVFTKPASVPCGHNFCYDCITNYWDSKDPGFACPLCNETFSSRPILRVNTIIAELIEKFKKTTQEKSSGRDEEKQAGEVLCSICAGAKLTALSSCLDCVLSYCGKHLEPHQRIPTLMKHKLISPVEDLESRLCSKHGKPLEMFCFADQIFICDVCQGSCSKFHKIGTIEEAARVLQTQNRSLKKQMEQMIEQRQQKIKEIENSLEASRRNAAKALSCSVSAMTAAVDYIQRSRADLTEIVEATQGKVENEAEGFIEELDLEILQIKETQTHLDASPGDDPFVYLTNRSHGFAQPQVKDWTGVTLKWNPFPAQGARLTATVIREVSRLCDPDFKEKQQHAVDVTLDPATANPYLRLSADRKQVTHSRRDVHLPKHPERFDQVFSVLGKQGLCSRCYYEVQVKDKTQWTLGVVNGYNKGRGDAHLSPENGYWTIRLRKGPELTASANPTIVLPVRETLKKVGVFVDHKEGEVSFYDVDARANIFTFTECNFTEEVFPFFSPGPYDAGENEAPLVVTLVERP